MGDLTTLLMQKIQTIAICLSILWTTTDLLASEGTVQQVSGDLVYVTGMNGLAPLWSNLTVQNGQETGAKLEVIKELPELVIARVVEANGTAVNTGDMVTLSSTQSGGSARKSRRIVYAARVGENPNVDGVLDDAVWSRATPIRGFVQRDPNYWMPSPEQTIVRIIYTDKSIYFGFECLVPDSSQFIANNMRRDSEIRGDDNIQILLDTYNDRQNGFFFSVNPLGAQSDLMLSNEGRTYNRDWDCNWTARTSTIPTDGQSKSKFPLVNCGLSKQTTSHGALTSRVILPAKIWRPNSSSACKVPHPQSGIAWRTSENCTVSNTFAPDARFISNPTPCRARRSTIRQPTPQKAAPLKRASICAMASRQTSRSTYRTTRISHR